MSDHCSLPHSYSCHIGVDAASSSDLSPAYRPERSCVSPGSLAILNSSHLPLPSASVIFQSPRRNDFDGKIAPLSIPTASRFGGKHLCSRIAAHRNYAKFGQISGAVLAKSRYSTCGLHVLSRVEPSRMQGRRVKFPALVCSAHNLRRRRRTQATSLEMSAPVCRVRLHVGITVV